MTIFPTAAGPLLCLSPQDLPAGQPLTDDTLLPLVRRALIQNGKALPLHPELEVFPAENKCWFLSVPVRFRQDRNKNLRINFVKPQAPPR